jgi:hypothetical protein
MYIMSDYYSISDVDVSYRFPNCLVEHDYNKRKEFWNGHEIITSQQEKFYDSIQNEIQKKYFGKWVAIFNEKVVGYFDKRDDAVEACLDAANIFDRTLTLSLAMLVCHVGFDNTIESPERFNIIRFKYIY